MVLDYLVVILTCLWRNDVPCLMMPGYHLRNHMPRNACLICAPVYQCTGSNYHYVYTMTDSL